MAEETEVKTTEENTKPQESKSVDKPKAKAPAKPRKKRPAGTKRGAAPVAKKPAIFSDSLEDRFPNLAAKLKKKLEDDLKQKIKDAQNDPKVKEASKKFASK
ncbi:MAG: hypothetical protein HUK20_10675 [Fibrobacter sp.]|nr:hypothetical protein [Fibrobacter sp.]